MAKPKVSTDWLAGCSGCHMSLLDIDERIIQLVELVDIRSSPITDLKEPDEGGVDVGILEGSVNNTSNEIQARKMREQCKILIALGDCAVFGGIPAMRNLISIDDAMHRAYIETESTDADAKIPDDPELCKPTKARAVHEVVPVDIFLPGCPPDANTIFHVMVSLAQGKIPALEKDMLKWH